MYFVVVDEWKVVFGGKVVYFLEKRINFRLISRVG